MKIGTVEAGKGEKVYGLFKTGETHGRFPVHIPLHLIWRRFWVIERKTLLKRQRPPPSGRPLS